MVGLPELLARGGALWGGLPIPRPALHFHYTLLEEAFIIFGYLKVRSRVSSCPSRTASLYLVLNIKGTMTAFEEL
jgi:hypothetical protein